MRYLVVISLLFVASVLFGKGHDAEEFIPKRCLGPITVTDFLGACKEIKGTDDEAICKVKITFHCVSYRPSDLVVPGDTIPDIIEITPDPFPDRPQIRVLRTKLHPKSHACEADNPYIAGFEDDDFWSDVMVGWPDWDDCV